MNKEEIIKEFEEEIGKELGYISGIFMSQGNTKAKNIIMPTEELEETVDRIGLYLFKALKAERKDLLKDIEGMNTTIHKPVGGISNIKWVKKEDINQLLK